MNTYKFLLAAAFSVVTAATYAQPVVSSTEPLKHTRFRSRDVIVVIHARDHDTRLNGTENDIDRVRNVDCKSAKGCVLTITGWAWFNDSQSHAFCSYVDGVAAGPACPTQNADVVSSLQTVDVPTGIHTIETKELQGAPGGVISAWEVNYTLYELKYTLKE
jgi:hypothetical protein